jgi:hypothetical protein
VFLGKPDDFSMIPPEFLEREIIGINAIYRGDIDRALLAGGECAQRIEDLPQVSELVNSIIDNASKIITELPKRVVD